MILIIPSFHLLILFVKSSDISDTDRKVCLVRTEHY